MAETEVLPSPARRGGHDAATRFWLWASLFVLIGLPLLLVAGAVVYRAELIDLAVQQIPVKHEKQLAEALWQMQRPGLKLIEGRPANKVVEEIGQKLLSAKPSVYDYRWFVADDATVNAFAMPGGIIVVHRGLIQRADSAEELAGVIAHEIEHVERRHSLRVMVQGLGVTFLWMALTGDVGAGMTGDAVRQLAGLHFSREQGTEADQGGFAQLQLAGVSPHGMASFFEKMAADQGKAGEMLELIFTHPASSERSQRLRALLKDAPVPAPLPYDWAAIKASLSAK